MITLYQFPISHFCEKIRWALDYKALPYETRNLLPGLHIKRVMSIARRPEVPVLTDNEHVIQNSAHIIDYLDKTFADNRLTPIDEKVRSESLEWEKFVDKEIGPNIQVYFYYYLLECPDLLIPVFTHNGPWYGKIVMKLMFPKLRLKMLSFMKINEKSAALAKQKIKRAIDKINTHLNGRQYLTGNEFSRADLAAAALLAPLILPEEYALDWPSPMPAELQNTMDEWYHDLHWVRRMYKEHRKPD